MDNHKIGAFIAQRRREKGLTQQQLADRLFLSNKTISKWERGAGGPDTAPLPDLAKALEVSVDELLAGCRQPAPAAGVSDAAPSEPPISSAFPASSAFPSAAAPQCRAQTAWAALGAAIGAILGILAYNHSWWAEKAKTARKPQKATPAKLRAPLIFPQTQKLPAGPYGLRRQFSYGGSALFSTRLCLQSVVCNTLCRHYTVNDGVRKCAVHLGCWLARLDLLSFRQIVIYKTKCFFIRAYKVCLSSSRNRASFFRA